MTSMDVFVVVVKRTFNHFILFVICLLTIFNVKAECGLGDHPACFKDWIVSPETHPLCGGYFYEVPRPFPQQTITVLPNQPVTITAERGQFNQTGPTTLEGNIHLIQGNRQILADEAKIFRNPNSGKVEQIEALGHVQIMEPGFRLFGPKAKIDELKDIKTLRCAEYRLFDRQAHGTADCITTFGSERMIMDEASYTTCSPLEETWILRAKKIMLNRVTGRGQSYHARLYFKKVPIAYLPYFDFPIDDRRQTGFLYPRVDITSNSGFELAAPFYWNMAPNYDATITPRFLSRRGLDLISRFRYLSASSSGYIQGSILPQDRAYKSFRKEHLLSHPNIANNDPRIQGLRRGGITRRSLFTHHDARFNPNLGGSLDYQYVSDDNFFMNLGNSLEAANSTQLLRQGHLVYTDWHNSAFLKVQEFQTLHPFEGPIVVDPYRRMPQINFRNVYPDLESGIEWAVTADYTHFTHKKNPFDGHRFTTGDRGFMRPSLAYPIVTSCSFIKPRLQWNFLAYSLTRSPMDICRHKPKHPTLSVPIVDIDSGLIFERNTSVCNTPYVQTLEPRAYYLWVPCRRQDNLPNFDTTLSGFDFNQLFRDNRFSGLDRVGDANQVTLALTTRFLLDETGIEKLTATLGQIYYFKKRFVTLCDFGDPFFRESDLSRKNLCMRENTCGRENQNCRENSCCNGCRHACHGKKSRHCSSQAVPGCIRRELPDYNKHFSNYVGLLRYRLQEDWTFNSTGQWNPNKSRVDEAAFWLQYKPDELNVWNIGYLYLRHNPVQVDPITGLPRSLDQAEGSFAHLLNENWRLLGRVQFDLRLHRANEIIAGIEYQGCCTALRLSVQRYLQPNDFREGLRKYKNGIYIQFVFKGLGSLGGSKINSVLIRSIPGYRWQKS